MLLCSAMGTVKERELLADANKGLAMIESRHLICPSDIVSPRGEERLVGRLATLAFLVFPSSA